ncbi:MAG: NfeD family protein [Deltaproteobacteria bacterium]|jgi:membrane protein implicated in regulation of membrane protease activity|nr:NfeD family protein [Deltaproteobacteria bacterium]
MLSAYIVCLVAGGIVLGASMFGGHDSDAGADADGGVDSDGGHDAHPHHAWVGRLPFLSLRFWTWAATFFGLTGLVLSLTGTSPAQTLILALVAGVGTGWGASYVLSKMTKTEVGVLPEASSHIGCEGKLLLPLAHGECSKVRLRVGGGDVDLVAESDSQEALPAGASVWVVGLRGTHVVVEASPTPSEDRLAATESDKEKP